MDGLLRITDIWLRRASLAAAACGGLTMLVMLGIVAANIAVRPFGGAVRGSVEISGYLCALAVGLCLPAAQIAGSHITAGVWVGSLPGPVRRCQQGASDLVCAALLALVARELFGLAVYAGDLGEYIEGFGFSFEGMAFGFAAGATLHALLFVHAALRVVFPATTGHSGGRA